MPKILTYFDLPPLPPKFYQGPSTEVARRLLGKVLVSGRKRSEYVALLLTEVEAYSQHGDEASHTHRGRTQRNESMFKVGGTCYVYRSYGIHNCMNVVAGKEGVGDGVLLRAGIPLVGEKIVRERRGVDAHLHKLCEGPGRLTQALAIDAGHNGALYDQSILKIVDAKIKIPAGEIKVTPRIGISKSKDLPWRFVWKPMRRQSAMDFF